VLARPDWRTLQPGLALFTLCLMPLLLPEAVVAGLEYRRDAILAGEVWRLWSGHLVHYSATHAVLDGLTCLILASTLHWAGEAGSVLRRLAVVAPMISLLLLLCVPAMAIYRGASGLAMALAAVLGLSLWRTQPGWRPALLLLALALSAKLAADALGIFARPSSLPAGIRLAWQVHAAGFVCGLLVWAPSGKSICLFCSKRGGRI
jgi:rhomboid family GlyGly-CTERM serine protease